MPRMNRVKKNRKNGRRSGKAFWDQEYAQAGHLALSNDQSEDLEKFTRWLERQSGKKHLNVTTSVCDLGCGNGRNLIWLSRTYGMRGVGFDISSEAITYAKHVSSDLPLTFEIRSIAEPVPLPDASQTLVLDMMASHVLTAAKRKALADEIHRILKPGGYLFFKTFLLQGDLHAKRLLKEHPGSEPGSYIHPEIGVEEHAFVEEEIEDLYERAGFIVHKMSKSHLHVKDGKAFKRRSISVYLQKPDF